MHHEVLLNTVSILKTNIFSDLFSAFPLLWNLWIICSWYPRNEQWKIIKCMNNVNNAKVCIMMLFVFLACVRWEIRTRLSNNAVQIWWWTCSASQNALWSSRFQTYIHRSQKTGEIYKCTVSKKCQHWKQCLLTKLKAVLEAHSVKSFIHIYGILLDLFTNCKITAKSNSILNLQTKFEKTQCFEKQIHLSPLHFCFQSFVNIYIEYSYRSSYLHFYTP